MRKSAASWIFAFAAVLALTFAPACMAGDDDDDDGYKCDWGQPLTQWGALMSPIQDCFDERGFAHLDECQDEFGDEEIQFTCKCVRDPDGSKCREAKERYG